MSEQGQPETGLARLLDGIAQLRASGTTMAQSHFAHLQARAYRAVGQIQKGLEVIEAALAMVDQSGEHWFDAELLRLQGELLQMQGTLPQVVQNYFEQAIAIARGQEAKMWELRATMSLCKLWHEQGRTGDARARLAEIYHWFTEGWETPDLQDARALLASLPPNQR
jgi:predicted ATPase